MLLCCIISRTKRTRKSKMVFTFDEKRPGVWFICHCCSTLISHYLLSAEITQVWGLAGLRIRDGDQYYSDMGILITQAWGPPCCLPVGSCSSPSLLQQIKFRWNAI